MREMAKDFVIAPLKVYQRKFLSKGRLHNRSKYKLRTVNNGIELLKLQALSGFAQVRKKTAEITIRAQVFRRRCYGHAFFSRNRFLEGHDWNMDLQMKGFLEESE